MGKLARKAQKRRETANKIRKRRLKHKQKKVALKKKTGKVTFTIDCTKPVEDGIMDAAQFENFLNDKIKVGGRAGMLGDKVKITRENAKIHITVVQPFSKRYLKYLTKKYLKANQIRDYLRPVADSKESYELRYFNIHGDDDNEESGSESDESESDESEEDEEN
ncbi:60S ribosomal protein L22-RELATED [Anaeramoeba flamelloides]|uniref:Large ribosomal subunit protein eL22 n=1 Tax=Anaeramoeba flamelloides TaxID=1746091 RepID=A0AAV7Y1X7_9EUKA|nr:60S ribosomal protein L22-RELATED [Anaeramoeba flamelloides]